MGEGGRERMNCKFETEGIDNAIICIYVYMLYMDESRVELYIYILSYIYIYEDTLLYFYSTLLYSTDTQSSVLSSVSSCLCLVCVLSVWLSLATRLVASLSPSSAAAVV